MYIKTKMKIGFSIFFICWLIFGLVASDGDLFFDGAIGLIFLIPALFFVPFLVFSAVNDVKQGKEKVVQNKKCVSFIREILIIANENRKPLSKYDFMLKLSKSEEQIEDQLEEMVEKGIANKIINNSGMTLYSFNINLDDSERADMLE